MKTKHGLFLALLSASFCLAPAALAQAGDAQYPSRAVRFVVPFSPGGLGDTVARAVGQHLSQRLGQPVVIDNRPGGSEIIAAEAVAKAPADGHTLLLSTEVGMVFNPVTKKNLPYDPQRDFTPIALLFESPFYLVVNPSVPARSASELIALAKANPGKLTFGSIGLGSMQHLLADMFKKRTGVDILHVPYKGSGPAVVDLVSGQIDMMFQGGGGTLGHMQSGKLRALAATSARRPAQTQDLPTMKEAGIANFEAVSWFGIFAPAKLPRPILERLNAETVDFLKNPETRTRFAALGIELTPTTPEGLGERIRKEAPFWTKVIRDAGVEAD
jgi:tripartite-type tricarboxylate transporter receptor subunit TctC